LSRTAAGLLIHHGPQQTRSSPNCTEDQPHRSPQDSRVLWIDDELQQDDSLLRLLAFKRITVEVAETGAEGLSKALANPYDVILLDLKLPDLFGMTVLRRLIAACMSTPVIVASGWYIEPEIDDEARNLGAMVFHKPVVDIEQLVATICDLRQKRHAGPSPMANPPHGIVGASAATRETVAWVERVAPSNVGILLMGETGTGKEVVALAVHRASTRRAGPFLPVNCGAIPEALFESELFGYRKGVFTGAKEDKAGLVEMADGGTLFLDEIGEMPLPMQVRLLRCLDGGRVRRIGEIREHIVDVRVIAATNRSLQKEIAAGRFREDLYFRLAAARFELTRLRQRPDDVEALVRHWLPQLARHEGRPNLAISPDAMAVLRAHGWPGNARELRNVLAYALCLESGPVLGRKAISTALSARVDPSVDVCDAGPKRDRALAAVEACGGNHTEAARRLGIGRSTLWRWLQQRY
jgi:DNA-binding NtrC family response regulator